VHTTLVGEAKSRIGYGSKRYVPINLQYSIDVDVLALCLGHVWLVVRRAEER